MTLVRLFIASAIVLSSVAANALPSNTMTERPGFGRGPGFGPGPGPHPGYGGPGRGGWTEQKSVTIQRRVVNEELALRQLIGLGPNFEGYIVESVVVDVLGGDPRGQMNLMINGYSEDLSVAPRGFVTLFPRRGLELGRDINTLRLRVHGWMDIRSITVNLRQGRGGGGHGGGGGVRPPDVREIVVPVNVYQSLYGGARIDVAQYINLAQYRGMRIQAIDVEASARFQGTALDVFINGYIQNTLSISPYQQIHTIFPAGNAVIGYGADSIMLGARGELQIQRVFLRLMR